MIVHDLGPKAVAAMTQVDLAALGREPDSPIGRWSFHDCICGVGAFVGRPPWEHHTAGDELLLVLAGESDLTVIEHGARVTRTISSGELVIVPQDCWHSNDAPKGVTIFFMTPAEGNEISWDDPSG
jgi:mannose-6-phosphate isomerase-like protein (cupin superfamily)